MHTIKIRPGAPLTLLALLALVAAGLVVTGPTVPAGASPGDYQQPRVFKLLDPDSDVPSGDLIDDRLQVDPTLGQVTAYSFVFGDASVIVFGLGTPDAGGTCQPTLEIVGTSSHDTSWIVRAPGESTLPPAASATPYVAVDPRLVGFLPTCAVEHTSTPAGAPLDSATDLAADLVPVVQRDLTLFAVPKVLQEKPEHGFDLRFRFTEPPSVDLLTQSPLYGFDIELTPGPGVTLDHTQVLETPGSAHYQPLVDPHATVPGPGAYYIDVSVTAGNGDPWHARLNLWAVGGPHPRATQSLAGFGVYSHYLALNVHGDFQPHNAHLWFLTGRFATTANGGTGGGLPRCTHVTSKCQRYWYDARTGVLQVGAWRGFVTPDFVRWQAGYSSDLEQVETDFGPQFDGTYPQRLLIHWSGHRLPVGRYRYFRKPGIDTVGTEIQILAGGRYAIRTTATIHHIDERGTYRIAAGHITFDPDGGFASPLRFSIAAKGLHWRVAPRNGFLVADRFYSRVTSG